MNKIIQGIYGNMRPFSLLETRKQNNDQTSSSKSLSGVPVEQVLEIRTQDCPRPALFHPLPYGNKPNCGISRVENRLRKPTSNSNMFFPRNSSTKIDLLQNKISKAEAAIHRNQIRTVNQILYKDKLLQKEKSSFKKGLTLNVAQQCRQYDLLKKKFQNDFEKVLLNFVIYLYCANYFV